MLKQYLKIIKAGNNEAIVNYNLRSFNSYLVIFLFNQYNDVIQWLGKKTIADPVITEHIVNNNINIVAGAFSKPVVYIDKLVNKENFEDISDEDKKILIFFYKLFRKWMR